jgi:hypothetical protein
VTTIEINLLIVSFVYFLELLDFTVKVLTHVMFRGII